MIIHFQLSKKKFESKNFPLNRLIYNLFINDFSSIHQGMPLLSVNQPSATKLSGLSNGSQYGAAQSTQALRINPLNQFAGQALVDPKVLREDIMKRIKYISTLNTKAMNLFKMGERDILQAYYMYIIKLFEFVFTPLQLLEKAEKQVENLKKTWYFNQRDLGDLLSNLSACKALTTTYNNLGVFHKTSGKKNMAIKYLKLVLELEQEMGCMDLQEQQRELASTFVNICSIYSGMGKRNNTRLAK